MRPAILTLCLLGCVQPSTLDLTVFVSEAALERVPAFPVQVVVDVDNTGVHQLLPICEWESGFLQVSLDTPEYRGCQDQPKLLRAAIIAMDDCVQGEAELTRTFPDSRLYLAYGEEPIFETGLCAVHEETTLVVSPL